MELLVQQGNINNEIVESGLRSFALRSTWTLSRSFVHTYVCSLVAKIFRRHENFGGAKILEKVRAVAIDFVQELSKSEPSSRFLSCSKFENSACHFTAFSADRPGIWANLIIIPTNLGMIGRICKKVACAFLASGTHEMSCLQHRECLAWNTRNVLRGTQEISYL